MFDGSIEDPLALILLLLAFAACAPAGLLAVRTSREETPRGEMVFAIAALVLLWAVLTPLQVLNRKLGDSMVWLFGREGLDTGLVEYATVLLFVWAGLASAWLARRKPGVERWVYAAGAAAAVFIAGEEISWGQWLFHWATPEVMAEANLQGETNVHNFLGPQAWKLAYAAAGWTMIAGVMAVRFIPAARRIGFAPLVVFGEARYAAALALSAGVMMMHPMLQEISELALAAAVAHAVGWAAARTRGRPATQTLVPA